MMKKSFIILATTLLFLASCTPKFIPYERTGEVINVRNDKNTITVSSNAVAADKGTAIYYAEIKALENILYRGIPNSNQENPMISNENEARSKHKEELDKLIKIEGYKRFKIESYSDYDRTSGGSCEVIQIIQFDLQALRKHLESTGIIRKFGL